MSNYQRGTDFTGEVAAYLSAAGIQVRPEVAVDVGLTEHRKKSHRFDLGSDDLIVECKYYGWTAGGNNPSAKIATLNEAMLYFLGAPQKLKKMLFLPLTERKGARSPETFAEYYVRLHGHFIPADVEVWELSTMEKRAKRLVP